MPSRKSQREQSGEARKAKRPSTDATPASSWAARERVSSFSSDVSDELDAIDRLVEAEEAAAANALALERHASGEAGIKDVEVDHVCELLYERLEEDAMMDLFGELQHEYESLNAPKAEQSTATKSMQTATNTAPSTCAEGDKQLLWHLVATPAMMAAFGSTVASNPTSGSAAVAVKV